MEYFSFLCRRNVISEGEVTLDCTEMKTRNHEPLNSGTVKLLLLLLSRAVNTPNTFLM